MANLRVDKITSTETFETTGSVQFDGSGDYLQLSSSNDFNFGSGSFTIEAWVYPKTLSADLLIITSNSTGGFFFGRRNTGAYIGYGRLDTAWDNSSGNDLIINQWNHVAVCRDSNSNIRVFLNGIQSGSTQTLSTSYNLNTSTIGGTTSDYFLNGHISNLRILKGTALYTENFTPPTRELTVTPETVLLACQHKTDATHEKTGKTITVNGNAVANELTPGLLTDVVKSGGSSAITGSVEFDGTGDYLSVTPGNDFTFGTNSFTIEMFVYKGSRTDTHILYDHRNTTGAQGLHPTLYYSGSNLHYYVNGSNVITTSNYTQNTWQHYALVRSTSTNTIKLYINGIQVASASDTNDYVAPQSGAPYIGQNPGGSFYFDGFISNLRIVKGTALYTDNFIPPTRELKKVPGTVLLCCQDSNDPLTEATGKTITGYGDLVQVGISTNLADSGSYTDGSTGSGVATFVNNVGIITGTNSSNRGILHKTVPVIKGNKYEFSFRSTDASTNGKAGVDSNDGTSDVLDDVTNAPDLVYFSGSTVPNLDSTTGIFKQRFTATTNEAVIYFQEIGAGTLQVTDISLTAIDGSNKGSNFTPQVGNDGSVEFVGPTKINTENYFYLPTGNTEDRGRGRGVFGSGLNPGVNTIDYVNIQSTGNAIDFGDLLYAPNGAGGSSSSTRGLIFGGDVAANTINFITISSTSNAQDFGDLIFSSGDPYGCSSSTRGICAGGTDSTLPATPRTNNIQYMTIASIGNAIDFGDLTAARTYGAAFSSPTRGVFVGGNNPSPTTSLTTTDFITISTTGNAITFGSLITAVSGNKGCSNSIRGLSGGGVGSPGTQVNTIEYFTIASTGNAVDFGDLFEIRRGAGACASSIRGVWGGGITPSADTNTTDYITIMTTGNSQDFGDLTSSRRNPAALSDSHGGLG